MSYDMLLAKLKPDVEAEAEELAKRSAAEDFYIAPTEPVESFASRLSFHRRRLFKTNAQMAAFLGGDKAHIGHVLRGRSRVSLKLAGKWAKLLCDASLEKLAMAEHLAGKPTKNQRHPDRMSFSTDTESLRHLYDLYIKSLGRGLVPHGSVHHLMGGIYKRLKARQKT